MNNIRTYILLAGSLFALASCKSGKTRRAD
jgi:hypothetical protein